LVFITGGLIGMPHTKTGVKMLAPFDALLDYFTELNSNNNNSKSQEPQLIKGGSYYVTGYGEYLGGNVEYWFMELNEKKINILSNDIKVVNSSEAQLPVLQIAGVDDYFSGFFYRTFGLHVGPNIRRALARSLTPRICTILLAHNPAEFYEVRDSIDIDVQFSGHTMAGQWFPFNILLYPMYPYFHGLYSHTKKKKKFFL